jgi:hypothetical protein
MEEFADNLRIETAAGEVVGGGGAATAGVLLPGPAVPFLEERGCAFTLGVRVLQGFEYAVDDLGRDAFLCERAANTPWAKPAAFLAIECPEFGEFKIVNIPHLNEAGDNMLGGGVRETPFAEFTVQFTSGAFAPAEKHPGSFAAAMALIFRQEGVDALLGKVVVRFET